MSDPASQEHRFPCDQCGSDYRFDPTKGLLLCDHCGHSESITSGPWKGATLKELDFNAAKADQLPDTEIEETRVSSCPNCAAQIEFDPDLFPEIVPWLMYNRDNLTILVHPDAEDSFRDHAWYPLWMGEKLDLRLDFLRRGGRQA